MLAFLFNSTMFLVFAGSLALMWALRRHKKYKKYTSWAVFALALIAGSAAALSFLGGWASALLLGLLAMLGAPGAAVGIAALAGVVVLAGDLVDGTPDGAARVQALVLPTLFLATGGQLGLFGSQVTGAASTAGTALFGSLIGLGG
jgi:hypothetical protein